MPTRRRETQRDECYPRRVCVHVRVEAAGLVTHIGNGESVPP